MRMIGLDGHRSFAVAAAVEDATVRQLGRIELTREKVLAFARQHLRSEDEVVLEATGNTFALATLHAAGFLPQVWQPDAATERLRRQVAQRSAIVQQMTRLKNRVICCTPT